MIKSQRFAVIDSLDAGRVLAVFPTWRRARNAVVRIERNDGPCMPHNMGRYFTTPLRLCSAEQMFGRPATLA